jgi:hypothetical protein
MRESTSVADKPAKGRRKARISLVLSKPVRKALEAAAKQEKRSLNAQCVVILERGLAETAATG